MDKIEVRLRCLEVAATLMRDNEIVTTPMLLNQAEKLVSWVMQTEGEKKA